MTAAWVTREPPTQGRRVLGHALGSAMSTFVNASRSGGRPLRALTSSSLPPADSDGDSEPHDNRLMNQRCQHCGAALHNHKRFYKRYRVCEKDALAPAVLQGGELKRFCQQCGRFHPLDFFDGTMRTCREQLARHASLKRKRRREKANAAAAIPPVEGTSAADAAQRPAPKQRKLQPAAPAAARGQQQQVDPQLPLLRLPTTSDRDETNALLLQLRQWVPPQPPREPPAQEHLAQQPTLAQQQLQHPPPAAKLVQPVPYRPMLAASQRGDKRSPGVGDLAEPPRSVHQSELQAELQAALAAIWQSGTPSPVAHVPNSWLHNAARQHQRATHQQQLQQQHAAQLQQQHQQSAGWTVAAQAPALQAHCVAGWPAQQQLRTGVAWQQSPEVHAPPLVPSHAAQHAADPQALGQGLLLAGLQLLVQAAADGPEKERQAPEPPPLGLPDLLSLLREMVAGDSSANASCGGRAYAASLDTNMLQRLPAQ
ncbi:Squamosa promoter-binding protein 2 [Chlorella vulgaris]